MFQTWNSSKWTWWYHCGKANALTTSPTVWGTELYSQVFSYWPTVGWKYNRNKPVLFFHVLDFVGLPCVVACVCVRVCDLLFPQALTMHTPLHRANLLSLFLIWSIILCLFELFPHMFIHLWNILICHYHLDTPGYEHLNGSITANEVLVFCPVSFVCLSAWRQHSGPGGEETTAPSSWSAAGTGADSFSTQVHAALRWHLQGTSAEREIHAAIEPWTNVPKN